MLMRRLLCAAAFAALLFSAEPDRGRLVSTGMGDLVRLYERPLGDILMFTLENRAPSSIVQLEFETWVAYAHGPARRVCSFDAANAEMAADSTAFLTKACTLTADPDFGRPVSHRTRIVAVRLANGWKWHLPQSQMAVPKPASTRH